MVTDIDTENGIHERSQYITIEIENDIGINIDISFGTENKKQYQNKDEYRQPLTTLLISVSLS